jgi:hypothetical protein
VLIDVWLIMFGLIGFIIFLILISYGASLEDKYRKLEKKYKALEKEKEQQK